MIWRALIVRANWMRYYAFNASSAPDGITIRSLFFCDLDWITGEVQSVDCTSRRLQHQQTVNAVLHFNSVGVMGETREGFVEVLQRL